MCPSVNYLLCPFDFLFLDGVKQQWPRLPPNCNLYKKIFVHFNSRPYQQGFAGNDQVCSMYNCELNFLLFFEQHVYLIFSLFSFCYSPIRYRWMQQRQPWLPPKCILRDAKNAEHYFLQVEGLLVTYEKKAEETLVIAVFPSEKVEG